LTVAKKAASLNIISAMQDYVILQCPL